jgi:hypothetical protein
MLKQSSVNKPLWADWMKCWIAKPSILALSLLALLFAISVPAHAFPKLVKRIETRKPDGLPEYVRFEGSGLTSLAEISPEDAKKHFDLRNGPELIVHFFSKGRVEAVYGLRSNKMLKILAQKPDQDGDYRVNTGVFSAANGSTLFVLTGPVNGITIETTWYGDFAVFGRDDPLGIVYFAEVDSAKVWSYTYLDVAVPPYRCGDRELEVPYVCVFKQFGNSHDRLLDGSFYVESQNSLLRISDKDGSFVRNGFVRRMKYDDALQIKQALDEQWTDATKRWQLHGKDPMTEAMRRVYRGGRLD